MAKVMTVSDGGAMRRRTAAAHAFRCAVIGNADVASAVAQIVDVLAACADIELGRQGPWVPIIPSENFCAVIYVVRAEVTPAMTEHIAQILSQSPTTAVLVTAVQATSDLVAMVLKAGASDLFSFPLVPGELLPRLQRAMGSLPVRRHCVVDSQMPPQIRGLHCESLRSREVAARITALAGCDANVLIVGETGSGKEICAQSIHYLSRRAALPWIAVNCGAIPAELVENELFGHVRGAYTTAHAARSGLVHEAEQGTLFLDDVDCLPLAAQAKLLRFIQEREYRPVGSNTVVLANVRVIAASNRDLKKLAMGGQFRQDLYFRLNVLRINLPALRERREDIAGLARHFIEEFAREFGRPVAALTPAALRHLMAYTWPGNVRELRHVIERAVLLSRGPVLRAEDIEIDADDAPDDTYSESFSSAKARVVRDFERDYLSQMLAAAQGNVTRAAQAAKKDRRAFFELLRKHDIEPQQFRNAAC